MIRTYHSLWGAEGNSLGRDLAVYPAGAAVAAFDVEVALAAAAVRLVKEVRDPDFLGPEDWT